MGQLYHSAAVSWSSCIMEQLYHGAAVSWSTCTLFAFYLCLHITQKEELWFSLIHIQVHVD